MGKVTIQDIAVILSERHGLTKKDASGFVGALFDVVRQALERDRIVKIKGFGTFKIIDVDARESVNVNTGERVLIEGHNKITFTPDALMKELVNKPFSQFETVVLNEGVDFEDTLKTVESLSDEIPLEEAASEETLSENVPTENVPTENVPAEDVPVEEIPAEEVPATTESADDVTIDPAAMPLVDFSSETDEDVEENSMNEILDEDIPEWVIEPYVPEEKTSEPELESEPEPESISEELEPELEPEPEPESEPVSEEPEPEPESEPEPVAEEPEELETPIIPEAADAPAEFVEETIEEPVEEPVEEPIEESVEEPVEEVVEEPVKESIEEPVKAFVEEPVEEPQEEVEDNLTEEPEDSEISEDYYYDRPSNGKKWLIGIIAGLLGLVGGYFIGNFLPLSNVLPEYRLVFERVNTEKPSADIQKSEKVEPVATVESAEPVSDVPSNLPAEKAKAEPSEEKVPAAEKKTVVTPAPQSSVKVTEKKAETPVANKTPDQYEAMDARVRLGAYRIVGTNSIEKVREGDNLAKIARRTLGPDMECYIEVYNGLNASSQLKTGQAIKIPKLEWKKKKKAQTVN